jgi:hypothetical protein
MDRKSANSRPTFIRRDECYGIEEFGRRLGLGRHGLRSLRRMGLPVIRIAGRAFVDGGQALDFLVKVAGADETNLEG